VVWRLVHTLGLGIVLRGQSEKKMWTAHFIRHGYTAQDAFANWKRFGGAAGATRGRAGAGRH